MATTLLGVEWGDEEMNPKLVKKLSLGTESYEKITWKGFFTQCEVVLSSIVDHKLYISDYDSDSVASETSLREACYVYVRFMLKSWSIVPCEQCLLQARRYATKGEKPLRATVSFSIEHACPRDSCVKTSNGNTSSCFAGNILETLRT